MRRKFVLPLALAVVIGLGSGATAQTTTLPAIQEIRVLVNFPTPTSNVTGFTVETICRDLTGLPTGAIWTQTFSFTATGGNAKALYPLSASTSCVFRLTVLGTGARGIGTGFIVGGVVRAVTFPNTVNGQAVDAQSVAESEPIAITRDTDAIFGVPVVVIATVPTTTIATTTTAATTTTTRPPTTTAPSTTTAPATTTRATTAATTGSTTAATTQPTVATTTPASKVPTTKAAVKTRRVRRCTKVGQKTKCRTVTVRVNR